MNTSLYDIKNQFDIYFLYVCNVLILEGFTANSQVCAWMLVKIN